jgi:hypothetical protein
MSIELAAIAAEYGATEIYPGPGPVFTCVIDGHGVQFTPEQVAEAVAKQNLPADVAEPVIVTDDLEDDPPPASAPVKKGKK